MNSSYNYHSLDLQAENNVSEGKEEKQLAIPPLARAIATARLLSLHLQNHGVKRELSDHLPRYLESLSEVTSEHIELFKTAAVGLLQDKIPMPPRRDLCDETASIAIGSGLCGAVPGCLCAPCVMAAYGIPVPPTMSLTSFTGVASYAKTAAIGTGLGCATGIATGLLCAFGAFAIDKCKEQPTSPNQVWARLNELCHSIERELLPLAQQAMPAAPRAR